MVILSDGMTEQSERQELMELIRSRPMSVRVFCIGIGNEVNRPLLEQMADDSGGLAAFISRSENFERQARALEQSASLLFPVRDIDNPEIERMWAWKRVDQLLKKADKGGSRVEVLSDIVALGEKYSIVTEYTSFLVLENDAEYKRWKIERRNEKRLSRDREAQARRQEELNKIREKAIADLGPQKTASEEVLARASKDRTNVQQPIPSSQSQPAPRKSRQSHDFDFGSGPVGPLFVGIAFWLRRRKGKQLNNPEVHDDGGMAR